MPKLQTLVDFPKPAFQVGFSDTIFFLGSCFSSNIGHKLYDLKFQTCINPFGVLYNPASIANAIQLLLKKKEFNSKDLHHHNGLWLSFSHYTSFSHTDKHKCLDSINHQFLQAKEKFKKTNVLFITLGTSYIYKLAATGNIVANCHKIPAREFTHEFLSSERSFELLSKSIEEIKKFLPEIKIVFTVSPIRHHKDGAIQNMRSKAALILAIDKLEQKFPFVSYFPVYELFMDEMRDYRFYADDLVHPSEFAIDYTWEKFSECYFSAETRSTILKIERIVKSLQHRPIIPDSPEYQKFLLKLKEQILDSSKKLPHLDFTKELNKLSDKKN